MSESTTTDPNVVVKYSSYTDAQKRATQKYRLNNKDKVNDQRKKYYQFRKESDPQFLEYKRSKAREYYQRKRTTVDDSERERSTTFTEDDLKVLEELKLSPFVPLELTIPEPIVLQHPMTVDADDHIEVPAKKTRKPRKVKEAVEIIVDAVIKEATDKEMEELVLSLITPADKEVEPEYVETVEVPVKKTRKPRKPNKEDIKHNVTPDSV